MMVKVQIVGASRDVQRAPGARARLCSSSPLCLLVLVSYRPLAPREALYGSGACGGVFRTEYRGLLRFLLDDGPLISIGAAAYRTPRSRCYPQRWS